MSKNKYMVFHTPQKRVIYPTLNLNNANIERVSQFNFFWSSLGLHVEMGQTYRTCRAIFKSFKSKCCFIQIKAYLSTEGVTKSV